MMKVDKRSLADRAALAAREAPNRTGAARPVGANADRRQPANGAPAP
jgi:hypothetical protein